jgi:hypothetical protein
MILDGLEQREMFKRLGVRCTTSKLKRMRGVADDIRAGRLDASSGMVSVALPDV